MELLGQRDGNKNHCGLSRATLRFLPLGDSPPSGRVQSKVIFSILQVSAGSGHGKHGGVFHWLIHLGALGIFGVAVVDASIIPLAIPGSADLLLLWLIAHGANSLLYVSCAVAGSLLGGYTTWRLGKKGGEEALKRYVSPRLQDRVKGWSQTHPLLAVMLPAMLPPPIPLWPFLLTAGALGASWRRFLAAFGAGRALRYSFVGWLAARYGRHVIKIWSKTLDHWSAPILWTFVILTIAGIVYSIWKTKRTNRLSPGRRILQPKHAD
jgi:membrane protein YqaA with SNARE-associated domain